MLRFVLTYRKAIDQVTTDKDLKLRKYELHNNGWVIVGDLISVLEKYKKATVFFSQDGEHLNPAMQKLYHLAIQAAMKLAHKKLNWYYSMTDLSSAYWIAMGKQVIFFSYTCADFIFSPSPRFKT
jgi:hypothetical protein